MADMLKIAVMGGGGSAQTMAAELALAGFEVNLSGDLPEFAKNIEPIMKSKKIEKYGSLLTKGRTGCATLNKVTTDVTKAIEKVDVILIAVPAFGHMAFYEAIADCLEEGQTVVIIPGNWGALRLYNLLQERTKHKQVNIAETDRCLHFCRAAESWLGPER